MTYFVNHVNMVYLCLKLSVAEIMKVYLSNFCFLGGEEGRYLILDSHVFDVNWGCAFGTIKQQHKYTKYPIYVILQHDNILSHYSYNTNHIHDELTSVKHCHALSYSSADSKITEFI